MGRPDPDRGCAEYQRLSRRQTLTAGACGVLGLTLADLLQLEAAQAARSPNAQSPAPNARSCILLWLRGGPSSIDMWDLKPDAPAEIRGEFKPIRTNVRGIEISEHLPLCAKVADKFCLVRSVTHPREDHEGGSHVMASGWNTWPQQTYPMYGTVAQKVLGYRGVMPPHIHLPEPPQEYSGGKHHLSNQDFPFVVNVQQDLDMKVRDVSAADGLTPDRFSRRQHLLAAGGLHSGPLAAGAPTARANDVFYQRAFDMLTSRQTRDAFDVTREPSKLRDLYGRGELAKEVIAQGNAGDVAPNEFNRSIVGQSLLMARRLVEAGVRFVTVVGRGWDTHGDNFNRLKNQLLPHVDRAVSALLTDLADRGLLDTTLVVVTGDFNRTPKINRDAGRDHWGYVQTVFLAGGGVPGGTVLGASDAQCAYPADRPLTPADLAATLYAKLGIDPETEIHALDGRPFRIVPDGGTKIRELI